MKKKLTFIMILVVLALTSCSDFLDKNLLVYFI